MRERKGRRVRGPQDDGAVGGMVRLVLVSEGCWSGRNQQVLFTNGKKTVTPHLGGERCRFIFIIISLAFLLFLLLLLLFLLLSCPCTVIDTLHQMHQQIIPMVLLVQKSIVLCPEIRSHTCYLISRLFSNIQYLYLFKNPLFDVQPFS